MKRLVIIVAIAVVLMAVLAAPALADQATPQGAKGADTFDGYQNPGEWFQAIRANIGMGPGQGVKTYAVDVSTVGEYIYYYADR